LVKTVAMGMSIAASSQADRNGVAAWSATIDAMTDVADARAAEVARAIRSYVLDILIPAYNKPIWP
jgi:hypothetical protein